MSLNIIDLPNDVLIILFEYLTYEEVAQTRLVSRKIDQVCQHVLNKGFSKAIRQHAISYKRIKALLPRRESERRNHSLARHADILSSIETRISMLSMTYTKYIDFNLCCFIPGRILDEIFRILRLISQMHIPLRPHEVLQELRDISSMAIEHFDEKIATILKGIMDSNIRTCSTSSTSSSISTTSSSSGSGSSSAASTSGATIINSTTINATNAIATRLISNVNIGIEAMDSMGLAGNNNHIWNIVISSAISAPNACMSSQCCESIRRHVNNIINVGQKGLVDAIKQHASPQANIIDTNEMTGDGAENSAPLSTQPIKCPTLTSLDNLEIMYKRGLKRLNHVQNLQKRQGRELRQAITTINDLTTHLGELKKRFEDVDAKNRELTERVNHMGSEELSPDPCEDIEANVAEFADVTIPAMTCANEAGAVVSTRKRPAEPLHPETMPAVAKKQTI